MIQNYENQNLGITIYAHNRKFVMTACATEVSRKKGLNSNNSIQVSHIKNNLYTCEAIYDLNCWFQHCSFLKDRLKDSQGEENLEVHAIGNAC